MLLPVSQLSSVFFIYIYFILISPYHKIRSPEAMTSPEREKKKISQYTCITVYTHLCLCKPDEISKMNKQYNLVSNIAPHIKQIHPRRNNITGLVTICNRLYILQRLRNWERLTCFGKAPKAIFYAVSQLFSTSKPDIEVLI